MEGACAYLGSQFELENLYILIKWNFCLTVSTLPSDQMKSAQYGKFAYTCNEMFCDKKATVLI